MDSVSAQKAAPGAQPDTAGAHAASAAAATIITQPVERVFETDSSGVCELKATKDKIMRIPVSNTPIKCLARLKDIEGNGYGLKFGWTDEDGNEQDYSCWLDEAWSVKSEINEVLVKGAAGGFYKSSDFRAFVHASATAAREGSIPTVLSTSKSGWGSGFNYYSANGFQWGKNPPSFMARGDGHKWEKCGDHDEYIREMTNTLEKNPVVAFVCGFFIGGALVKLVGAENFMLSLVGRTSSGKTLAYKTALSMLGNPKNFKTFNTTANNINKMLYQSGDSCMGIDEIGQSGMSPEQKQKFIYDVSQGKERGRLTKKGGDFVTKESPLVNYTVIFTGEESIIGEQNAAGSQVRVTEFIFDGETQKVWNTIKTNEEAEDWELFISDNHGWLMPEIIKHIGENHDACRELYKNILRSIRAVADAEGLIEDQAGSRKLKTFALALTGSTILGDILGIELDLNSPVMNFAIEKIRQGVATSATTDSEKYADFISAFPVRFADRLYGGGSIGDQVRSPVGEVVKTEIKTTIKVIAAEFEKICGRENIDMKRLLEWGARSGVLLYNMNGGGKRSFKKRLKVNGGAPTPCYEFEIRNDEGGQYIED